MNEHALKTIVDFANLPETQEIKEIKYKYMKDEISRFEFLSLAREVLDGQKHNWITFTQNSIEAINKCKLVKLLRKDGEESFVLHTPVDMNEIDIETTTHWMDCSDE